MIRVLKPFNIGLDLHTQDDYRWRRLHKIWSTVMKRNKKPTIVDVARAAGVSVGSASNVLNNTRFVSEEIREKVLRTAADLEYLVNPLAQTLRSKRSGVICFCTTSVTTVYLRSLADALDAIATANGFELVQVMTHADPDRELQRIRSQIGRQVDGLFLLPSLEPQRSLDVIASTRTPGVVLDRWVDDERFSCVAFDNRSTMRAMAREMISLGHRRILFIAQNLSVITTRHRIEGLRAEMDAASISNGECLIMQQNDDQDAFSHRLADIFARPSPPTAVITGNSQVAIATIRELQAMKMRWPEDVSLASFDDPEWAGLISGQLSTVVSPVRTMVKEAWELLAAQMRDPDEPRHTRWIESAFVKRSSIGAPPRD